MKIQGITEVRGIMFVLDVDEALKAANGDKTILSRIGNECCSMLRLCGINPETGEKIVRSSSLIEGYEQPKLTKPIKTKGTRPKNHKCQYCGKMFAGAGFARHEPACKAQYKETIE